MLMPMTFTPTAEQQAIIDLSKTGESFTVTALAGTGKTTTLKQICKESPERNYLYVAFNNTVAKDFREWVKKEGITNVKAMTGDAIAVAYINHTQYAPYNLALGSRIGDGLRLGKDIAKHFEFKELTLKEYPDPKGKKQEETVTLTITETINYLKKGIENFCISIDDKILPKHFDKYEPTKDAISYANTMWEDYNDPEGGVLKMQFYAIFKMFALSAPSMRRPYDPKDDFYFDTLLIDEAQDTNPVAGKQYKDQHDMQVIYVGDPNQAIYGFRGAEDEMQKRSDLKVLPLTESWRFGSNIANFANHALGKLKSPTYLQGNAPDPGEVILGIANNADAIVQRTNSGCLTSILYLLHNGERPLVDAKTKEEIISLVASLSYFAGLGPKPVKIDEELEEFDTIGAIEDAIEKKQLPNRIRILLEIVLDEKQGPEYLLELLAPVSNRGHKGTRIITTHRAKGDEWDVVQLGSDFFGPRWDKEDQKVLMPDPSELMLVYVAATRAKKELYYNYATKFILMTEDEIYQDLRSRYESNSERNC
jgi:superfamily I DNA/RNA helicase